MTQFVAATLQRLLATRTEAVGPAAMARRSLSLGRDVRPHRPDFADTRPVVFRSEAFAEDLVHAA
jgi:hypothetical protein